MNGSKTKSKTLTGAAAGDPNGLGQAEPALGRKPFEAMLRDELGTLSPLKTAPGEAA